MSQQRRISSTTARGQLSGDRRAVGVAGAKPSSVSWVCIGKFADYEHIHENAEGVYVDLVAVAEPALRWVTDQSVRVMRREILNGEKAGIPAIDHAGFEDMVQENVGGVEKGVDVALLVQILHAGGPRRGCALSSYRGGFARSCCASRGGDL
jgi:hypothetical protein